MNSHQKVMAEHFLADLTQLCYLKIKQSMTGCQTSQDSF